MTQRHSKRWPQRAGAFLVLAAAALGASTFGYPATATAEAPKWDPDSYGQCAHSVDPGLPASDYLARLKWCCAQTGGVWVNDDQVCVAPSADTQGTRRFPGKIQIPSDIATVPVTQEPPSRRVALPPELTTEPAVTAQPT